MRYDVVVIIDYPLITEKTDSDLYKFTMAAVVLSDFPKAIATYEFFNRGKTQFPEGFADELRNQVNWMSKATTAVNELDWLQLKPYVSSAYVEWFSKFQFDPNEVIITQNGGDIHIRVYGPWHRTIYWEVPLMAIISELYFIMTGTKLAPDWLSRIHRKGINLYKHECLWADFGTRRRRSKEVHNSVVSSMKYYKGFMGTSNIHLAYLNEIEPIGTFAHEAVMAMSGLYGVRLANRMWMKHWMAYYMGLLGIALTDTYTTDVFLRDFGTNESFLWDGLRQDSGDPYDWTDNKIIPHFKRMGVSLKKKKLVYSDALTDEKFVPISLKYRKVAIPIAGIGTYLTNDTLTEKDEALGIRPLNMVIKLTAINFGGGTTPVVKLSDDVGKHTGNSNQIEFIMKELGIGKDISDTQMKYMMSEMGE